MKRALTVDQWRKNLEREANRIEAERLFRWAMELTEWPSDIDEAWEKLQAERKALIDAKVPKGEGSQ